MKVACESEDFKHEFYIRIDSQKRESTYKEIEEIHESKSFLDFIKLVAEREGKDLEYYCMVTLPCFYIYLPKLAISLVERGFLLALIPLGVVMDKAEIHEKARYPVSRKLSPTQITSKELDRMRFKEIVVIVKKVINGIKYMRFSLSSIAQCIGVMY